MAASRNRPSRRSRGVPRARTTAPKYLTREKLLREWFDLGLTPEQAEAMHDERPRTRGECVDGPRPCPWVSCKYHLAIEINSETGSIKLVFPTREVWELDETCALDVADRGGMVLERVGEITNLTRERIRQVEVRGLIKLKLAPRSEDLKP